MVLAYPLEESRDIRAAVLQEVEAERECAHLVGVERELFEIPQRGGGDARQAARAALRREVERHMEQGASFFK